MWVARTTKSLAVRWFGGNGHEGGGTKSPVRGVEEGWTLSQHWMIWQPCDCLNSLRWWHHIFVVLTQWSPPGCRAKVRQSENTRWRASEHFLCAPAKQGKKFSPRMCTSFYYLFLSSNTVDFFLLPFLLHQEKSSVTSLAYSEDGSILATGHCWGAIHLWDGMWNER